MNNGNVNNNNKTNPYRVRAVAPVPGVSVPATTEAVYDIPFLSIIEAWISCERNKKSSNSCIKFRWHCQRDLVNLWMQMRSGTYVPKASMVFIVTHPVLREVWAGAFRDRVAHDWEALRFGPVLEDFIVSSGNNSMNCRKGFGGLLAVKTLEGMIRDYTEGYTRDDCYILGGDFANYFMSIDKDLLWTLLEQIISDEYDGEDKEALLYMMRTTLFHKCQENYFRKSDPSSWKDLPPRKSLFNMNGLPIGNLPSQLWANFFGAIFMHWMMFVKKHPEFIIFVDDWRVLVRSLEEGRALWNECRGWLAEQIHVTLHPDKVCLQHYTKGTKVVGAVIKPRRSYISNRTRGHFINRMRALNAEAMATTHQGRVAMLEKVRASVNSYLGMMVHYRSYKVRRRICTELILPVWGRYLYFTGEFSKCVLKKQYDRLRVVRRKLRKSWYARRFIRPKYKGED